MLRCYFSACYSLYHTHTICTNRWGNLLHFPEYLVDLSARNSPTFAVTFYFSHKIYFRFIVCKGLSTCSAYDQQNPFYLVTSNSHRLRSGSRGTASGLPLIISAILYSSSISFSLLLRELLLSKIRTCCMVRLFYRSRHHRG